MIPNGSDIPDLLRDLVPRPDSVTPGPGPGQEEEQDLSIQQVGASCPICNRRVIRIILATPGGLRQLQCLLLSESIELICNRCVRRRLLASNNGRP